MIEKATAVPHPIEFDKQFLHLYPSASGPQHDERKSSRVAWKQGLREVPTDAPLHPTVIERLKLKEVLMFDEMRPYRPEPLRPHQDAKRFYQ